jgi:large subunit ribosomal protein L40e
MKSRATSLLLVAVASLSSHHHPSSFLTVVTAAATSGVGDGTGNIIGSGTGLRGGRRLLSSSLPPSWSLREDVLNSIFTNVDVYTASDEDAFPHLRIDNKDDNHDSNVVTIHENVPVTKENEADTAIPQQQPQQHPMAAVAVEVPFLQQEGSTRRIYVKLYTGKTITIDADSYDTILDVKHKITDIVGIPTDRQRLIYAGKLLYDNHTLEDYNIPTDATFTLVCRTGGGC